MHFNLFVLIFYFQIHAKILEAWKQYEEKELPTEALLKRLGRVYSPQ